MKKCIVLISALTSIMSIYSQIPADSLYFGFDPPGDSSVIFAPGFISLPGRNERTPNYAPDYSIFYFTTTVPGSQTYSTKYMNGWSNPESDTSFATHTSDLSISESGELACFTSWEGEYDGGKNTDIWVTEKRDLIWSEAELLPYPVNTSEQEWGACMLDSRTIYVCQRNNTHSDIVKYQYADSTYSRINLPEINTTSFEWDPYVPEDESYIIFKSDRPGGFGQMDLYISYLKPDGRFTYPKNLGRKINTTDKEDCGNLSPDGNYFLFARGDGSQNNVDLYWVNSGFIDSLRYTNFYPYVVNPIHDITDTVGNTFLFTIPDTTFMDDDGIETLSLEVDQSDGSSLPDSLLFDPLTNTIAGKLVSTGIFSIRVTATDTAGIGVADVFNLKVVQRTSGLTDDNPVFHLMVYPNPSNHSIHIKSELKNESFGYKIMDLNGRVVLEGHVKHDTIDVSTLQKGVYLLKIICNGGEVIEKIVIE